MGAKYSYKWCEYFQYSRNMFLKNRFLSISGYWNHSDSLILTKLRFLCDSAIPVAILVAIPVAIPNWVCDSETPAIPESQRFYHTKPAASFQAVAARQDVAAHGA